MGVQTGHPDGSKSSADPIGPLEPEGIEPTLDLAALGLLHRPWPGIRTTNPIESSFATIRLRTVKTRNCVSAKSGLSLVHQLAMSAQQRWRRLRGFGQLADVVTDVRFINGIDDRKIGRKAA